MSCGCGGSGRRRKASGTKSKVFARPPRAPEVQLPTVRGSLNLPPPEPTDAASAKQIKELNRQAVKRARGLT